MPTATSPRRRARRLSALGAVAATLASAALLTLPNSADAAPAPTIPTAKTTVVSHANSLTPTAKRLMKGTGPVAEAKAVASYWTPARMKAAKSLDNVVATGTAPRQTAGAPRRAAGPSVKVAPVDRGEGSADAPQPVEDLSADDLPEPALLVPRRPHEREGVLHQERPELCLLWIDRQQRGQEPRVDGGSLRR